MIVLYLDKVVFVCVHCKNLVPWDPMAVLLMLKHGI